MCTLSQAIILTERFNRKAPILYFTRSDTNVDARPDHVNTEMRGYMSTELG